MFTTSKVFTVYSRHYRVEADLYFGSTPSGGPDPSFVNALRAYKGDREISFDAFAEIYALSENLDIDTAVDAVTDDMFDHGEDEAANALDRAMNGGYP